MSSNNVTVVIRECGENTSNKVFKYACEEFGRENTHIVSEKPFSKALRASLEVGMQADKELILCLDADVIPIPNTLPILIEEIGTLPLHVPELQGMVYDNLFRVIRPAGNHLYRTIHAPTAIKQIPKDGTSLRPESAMLSSLSRKGLPWIQSKTVVGYHDFGQRPEDIYRKAFLHAHKHGEFTDYLFDLWTALSEENDEFKIAISAMNDSKKFKQQIDVDKDFMILRAREIANKTRYNSRLDDELDELRNTSIETLTGKIPEHLLAKRDACQKELNRKIFFSRGALLRKFVSNQLFEKLFK